MSLVTATPPARRAAPLAVPVGQAALFLDLDGTLTPLRPEPDDVRPEAALTGLLRQAAETLAGRVAIVSGRTLESVDGIVERACLAVAGVHGLQRRSATGAVEAVAPHPRIAHAAEQMVAFARGCPGLLVEHKSQSAALHYRGAPKAEPAVMEFVRRLADAEALVIQSGHMVMELRTPGPDKGAALRAFLSEAPFRGHLPIYVGDDHTDEAAFAAAEAAGRFGVLVGRPRPSAARYGLEDPAAVRAWIAEALAQGGFNRRRLFTWDA